MNVIEQQAWMIVYALRFHEWMNAPQARVHRAWDNLGKARGQLFRLGCNESDILAIENHVVNEHERMEARA